MRSKNNRINAIRACCASMGGIGYTEFLNLPFQQKEIILAELEKMNKKK